MEPKVRYTLVGLFVVLLGAGAVVIALWLARGGRLAEVDRYHAFMQESVAGLSIYAPVKYLGVDVGEVAEIAINSKDPREVRLTLDVAAGTPVNEDTVAVLRTQGLTGIAFIELRGGSPDAPLLTARSGEEPPIIKTVPSTFQRLDTAVSETLTDVRRLADDARAVIDEENRARIERILADLGRFTNALAKRSDLMEQGIASSAKALENIARLTERIDARMPEFAQRLDASAAALESAGTDVARAGRDLGAVVRDNRQEVDRFARQTLPEVGLLVTELRGLTESLQRVAQQLEENPNVLLFGRQPVPPGPGEGKKGGR